MFAWKRKSRSNGRLPDGERVYAIGDIHGEVMLFERLLGAILADIRRREPVNTTLVLLGDIIDRGEHGASLLHSLAGIRSPRLQVLKGNHEATLADCYHGDEDALNFWLQYGGRATLAGLGISSHDISATDPATLIVKLRSSIDPKVIDWVEQLRPAWQFGDYFFTHAGVQPGVALDRQDDDDLMWIREPFLASSVDHGKIIVHGHSIEQGMPRLYGNRIGLDTGAHEHGTLTALGLEGDQQWVLQASNDSAHSGNAIGAEAPYRPARSASAETSIKDREGRFIEIMRLISAITTNSLFDEATDDAATQREEAQSPTKWWKHGDRARSGRGSIGLSFALAACGVVGLSLIAVAPWKHLARPDALAPKRSPVRSSAPPPTMPTQQTSTSRAGGSLIASSGQNAVISRERKEHPVERVDVAGRGHGPTRLPTRPAGTRHPEAITAEPTRLAAAASDSHQAVHLTGAALEQALAEDRVATRRLNEAELAKMAANR